MKRIILFSLLFSLTSLAQTDWKSTYEKMENKEEKLSFEQYSEACQQGVEAACTDGWYNKVTREISLNEGGEATLNNKFLTKLKDICESPSTMMCDAGLNLLSGPLDNANKENAPGMEIANEIYNKYTVSNCNAVIKAGGQSYFCGGILTKPEINTESKATFDELTANCLNSKDNAVCELGLNATQQMSTSVEYLESICKDPTILNLPICAQQLQWKKEAEEKTKRSDSFMINMLLGLGAFAVLIVGIFIYSTKCPSCKKFFALDTIGKDNLGTKFSGTETENMKTGEVRDSNYNTVATIHRDVTFNVFKTKFKITKRCRKCGYTFKYDSTETKKSRA